jgi:hypothetical protein
LGRIGVQEMPQHRERRFRKATLERAVEAVYAAGLTIDHIDINYDGGFTITPGVKGTAPRHPNMHRGDLVGINAPRADNKLLNEG